MPMPMPMSTLLPVLAPWLLLVMVTVAVDDSWFAEYVEVMIIVVGEALMVIVEVGAEVKKTVASVEVEGASTMLKFLLESATVVLPGSYIAK